MNKLTLVGALCFSLLGCEVSDVPRFESMSEVELADYNRGRNIGQRLFAQRILVPLAEYVAVDA